MKSFFYYRSDWETAAGAVDVLVAFNAGFELDTQQLREIVEKEVQRFLRPDQLIIITRAATFDAAVAALSDDQTRSTLLERLGEGCHVELWSFDGEGETSRAPDLQARGRRIDLSLQQIVRRGATEIFNEHKGFVEGSENYHFRNPSGKHTNRFMRLSNILVRQAEIAFLAVGLLPLIPGKTRNAYIDTPALYAVISAVNDLRRRADGGEYIVTENFRSYFGVDSFPFTERDCSVAIISASSSGSLASKLVEKDFDSDHVIHLLYLGEDADGLKIAIDLARDSQLNPKGHNPERRTYEGKCALCDNGSMYIDLKGDQFDVSPPQPRPLEIKQKHAPKTLEPQMQRLVGSRCFSSSAAALNRIDPSALLAHKPYTDRLDYYLRRFVPAGAHFCVLADHQSEEWGTVAAARSNQKFIFVRADTPGDLEKQITDADGPILVMAAVIGSGRRLLDISRELRTAAPRAPITYIAGFAKPASIELRQTLKNSLIFSNHEAHHAFEIVEELVLPSAGRENAWDQERQFLSASAHGWAGNNRQFVDQRIANLTNASRPLVDDLFVANSYSGALKLRPGFAFWPEGLVGADDTQADVFATISSILQTLRTAPLSAQQDALRTGWFQQTQIHPEVFGRFNDGIIQASFLRAALPSELDYRSQPELSEALARLIGRIISGAHLVRGEGAFEFLLALGGKRLRLLEAHFELALPVAPPQRPLIQAMRKAVRSSLGI